LVISGGDGTVDLEVAEDALDAVSLSIKALVVTDRGLAARLRRNDRLDTAPLQIGPDSVGVIGFIGEERLGLTFRQIDQFVIGFAVCRLARREVECDGPSPGITETMNFTAEPAPRAAKSSSVNPPFPPAAETWARTEVESIE